MPRKIQLEVKRKTKVRSKGTIHLFRSDFINIDRIEYNYSKNLFRCLGGMFENEEEFCKWMKERYGKGIYLINVFKKGQHGFRNFLYVELEEKRFRRLKSKRTQVEKYKKKLDRELSSLKNQISKTQDKEKREELKMDIEEIGKELGEVKQKQTKKGHYPYPYLRACRPVLKWHSYSEEENDNSEWESIKEWN